MFGLPAKLSHGVLQLRFVESKFFPMTITGLGFKQDLIDSSPTGGRRGGGELPYIGYTGTCSWKGYGFQAI